MGVDRAPGTRCDELPPAVGTFFFLGNSGAGKSAHLGVTMAGNAVCSRAFSGDASEM
jgi:hypothetical protein